MTRRAGVGVDGDFEIDDWVEGRRLVLFARQESRTRQSWTRLVLVPIRRRDREYPFDKDPGKDA